MRSTLSRLRLAWLLALMACAAPRAVSSQELRTSVGSYELEVRVEGNAARSFEHAGQTYILGQPSQRYVLRIHNRTAQRVEAVVSVDGLDAIDGKPGAYDKRGYLVPAYGSVDVDGWRLSDREAAAFRFAAIEQSYAAKTGRPRDIGVIGVAVFPERQRYRQPTTWLGSGAPEPSRREAQREVMPAPAAAAPAAPEAAAHAEGSSPAADSAAPAGRVSAEAKRSRARSGLGTEFGEAVGSEVHEVAFTRARPHDPSALLGARYNDRAGLLALGIDVDGNATCDLDLRQSATPFPASNRHFATPPAGWRGR